MELRCQWMQLEGGHVLMHLYFSSVLYHCFLSAADQTSRFRDIWVEGCSTLISYNQSIRGV